MSKKIEEIKNSTQKPVKYKVKCVAHHGSNGLLNTLSFLKVSNSEGYHAVFSYSPLSNILLMGERTEIGR